MVVVGPLLWLWCGQLQVEHSYMYMSPGVQQHRAGICGVRMMHDIEKGGDITNTRVSVLE